LKLIGSISTFGEGSARRAAFLSGLAAVLRISENQLVIISVTEGSVIIELGFVRLGGAHPSPAEVVSRLKSAAASGELGQFGLTELTVGQDTIFISSSETSASVNASVIAGACVGGVIGTIVLTAIIRKLLNRGKKVHTTDQALEFHGIVDIPVPQLFFVHLHNLHSLLCRGCFKIRSRRPLLIIFVFCVQIICVQYPSYVFADRSCRPSARY
jgi:hypothetical protein